MQYVMLILVSNPMGFKKIISHKLDAGLYFCRISLEFENDFLLML